MPGFKAGIQALHDRFGKLPFRVLFQPAIWYAGHGVTVSPILDSFFKMRQKYLSGTPAGRRFLRQGGDAMPRVGDKFAQMQLAHTLREVAERGAEYMYTGPWGRVFVAAVRKAGGKATLGDMRAYRVLWRSPYSEQFLGHTLYVSGRPSDAVYQVQKGLSSAPALKLKHRGPYWSEPRSFRDLSRVDPLVSEASRLSPSVAAFLWSQRIGISRSAQRRKGFAGAVASILEHLYVPLQKMTPQNSNFIVVSDMGGDIAVMTHTINAVVWGDTGIVVEGIPLPDSAGFQQHLRARLKPGSRVPDPIACTLTFEGSQPVLATASIGCLLTAQTIATVFSVIAQKQTLASALAVPPALDNFAQAGLPLNARKVNVPACGYPEKFIASVKALGASVVDVAAGQAAMLRGSLAAAVIDPKTHVASTMEVSGVMVFAGSN